MSDARKRIVLIDDSEIILERIKYVLEDEGCLVTATTEPSRAAFAGARSPDLVLLDVNMPQAFGDDIARFLREAWGLESKIFLYSSLTETELEERARDAGADGFICKSWGIGRLVEEVRAILHLPKRSPEQAPSDSSALEEGPKKPADGALDEIQTVHHRFAKRCIERRDSILGLLEAHASGEAVDEARSVRTIAVQLHDFVGESKLLGLDRVASAASSLKTIVDERGRDVLCGSQLPVFRNCLEQLTQLAESAALDGSRDAGLQAELKSLQSAACAEPAIAAEVDDGIGDLDVARRILVVDDSPIVGEVLSIELEARGHEVAVATGLAEFNTHMKEFEPELIFLDVEMPDINGTELCKHLRQDPKSHALPIILLSGLPEEELADLATRSGANGSLSKQRGMDELINFLDDLMVEIVF